MERRVWTQLVFSSLKSNGYVAVHENQDVMIICQYFVYVGGLQQGQVFGFCRPHLSYMSHFPSSKVQLHWNQTPAYYFFKWWKGNVQNGHVSQSVWMATGLKTKLNQQDLLILVNSKSSGHWLLSASKLFTWPSLWNICLICLFLKLCVHF